MNETIEEIQEYIKGVFKDSKSFNIGTYHGVNVLFVEQVQKKEDQVIDFEELCIIVNKADKLNLRVRLPYPEEYNANKRLIIY